MINCELQKKTFPNLGVGHPYYCYYYYYYYIFSFLWFFFFKEKGEGGGFTLFVSNSKAVRIELGHHQAGLNWAEWFTTFYVYFI